ncbi:MAG: endonuclease/exonuclease/phosphatase family protein [Solirubrobacteraceae bacterium]
MREVRVITFNAAAGNPRITAPQESYLELPFYREALDGGPDAPLLALQEVGGAQARALKRAAGPFSLLQMRRPGLGNALVIPARYEVLSRRRGFYLLAQLRGIVTALRHGRRNWRQYGELRMWIEARLRDRETGRELTLLTTHVSADGDMKVPQAGAIVRRALAAAARGPVILAGDFNVPAGRERGRDVEAAAILARLRDMGTSAPPEGEDIDYVLAAGFEPVSTRFHKTPSDHYAEDDVLRYGA